jgi:hypothetical protein
MTSTLRCVVLGFVVIGCADVQPVTEPDPTPVKRVVFTPTDSGVFVGDSVLVSVVAFSDDGTPVGTDFDLSTLGSAIEVTSKARTSFGWVFYAKAVEYGETTINTGSSWIEGDLTIGAYAAGVEIEGVNDGDLIFSGCAVPAIAIPLNANGTPDGVSDAPVEWETSDGLVLGLGGSGSIDARAPGVAILRALVEKGSSDSVRVHVAPMPLPPPGCP